MTYKEPLLLGIGAAVGSAITALTLKNHYRRQADAEVEGMRQAYNVRLSEMALRNRTKPMPDIQEVAEALSVKIKTTEPDPAAMTNYREAFEREATEEEIANVILSNPGPVLEAITQDDFIEPNGYEKVNVIVYADGIAATEADDAILDVDDTIGVDAVPRMIRGNEEAIYIRNNDLMTDYEIVANENTYTEVTGIHVRG